MLWSDDICRLYKTKFRRSQIEAEGNDPAKSGEATGTPSDMAAGRTGHELDNNRGAPEGGFEKLINMVRIVVREEEIR